MLLFKKRQQVGKEQQGFDLAGVSAHTACKQAVAQWRESTGENRPKSGDARLQAIVLIAWLKRCRIFSTEDCAEGPRCLVSRN